MPSGEAVPNVFSRLECALAYNADWTSFDTLIEALRCKGDCWEAVTRQQIENIVSNTRSTPSILGEYLSSLVMVIGG